MIVKEVMRTNVISVSSDVNVTEAKDLMNKNNISKLPVIDHGKLVGIITKNDLLQAGPSQATTLDMYEISYLLSKLTVKKVMCAKVITIKPDEVVEEAARIMVDNQVGCLPVVKENAVVGIITESDLFHLFTDMFGARAKGVRAVVVIDDTPGQLAKLAQKIADAGGNIVSAVTSDLNENQKRLLTIKASGIEIDKMKEILNDISAVSEDVRML